MYLNAFPILRTDGVAADEANRMAAGEANGGDRSLLPGLSPTKRKTTIIRSDFLPPSPTLSAKQWPPRQWTPYSHLPARLPATKLVEGAKREEARALQQEARKELL